MNILKIIFSNLLGYDIIILILAFANLLIYLDVNKKTTLLHNHLNKTLSIPIRSIFDFSLQVSTTKLNLPKIEQLEQMRKEVNAIYHVFSTIITIFPLLGILGTVVSLLRVVNFSSDTIMPNFSTALTSTFWGLICAIIFKFLESRIISTVEYNNESLNLLISRIDKYQQEMLGECNE
ncbi:MAG: hypothetical protein PWP27_1229 [Clostridiales bacterium]|jgi:hypothetical protein|nr:hypothetical protein [Clostridiales bacterium]MDK2933419.1 hypothetical protein [Clostridiales bacterium]